MGYEGSRAGVSGAQDAHGRPRLLDEVRDRMRPRNYSLRTQQAYLYCTRRYIRVNGMRHTGLLDGTVVKAFTKRLAAEDGAVLAATAADPHRWELVHFSLWEHDTPKAEGDLYRVLHLSAPGRDRLPRGRHW